MKSTVSISSLFSEKKHFFINRYEVLHSILTFSLTNSTNGLQTTDAQVSTKLKKELSGHLTRLYAKFLSNICGDPHIDSYLMIHQLIE